MSLTKLITLINNDKYSDPNSIDICAHISMIIPIDLVDIVYIVARKKTSLLNHIIVRE